MSVPVVSLQGGCPQVSDHTLAQTFSKAREIFLRGDFETASAQVGGFSEEIAKASRSIVHGKQPDAPIASVVLLSHRHTPHLETALRAIAQQCLASRWEIILVENGNAELFEAGRRILDGFVGVTPPLALGCSSGRNLGAAYATSDVVVFFDDDGVMEPGCAQALLSCLSETGAIAVRGRVVPLTPKGIRPFDLGPERIPSFIDCEGVSAWRRGPFLEKGGFHPLVDGHEGIELCARLWRDHGPLAFVYEPSAVFRHDFATNGRSATEKKARYALNKRLVESNSERPFEINVKVQDIARDSRELYLATTGLRLPLPKGGAPVSVITTARNTAHFLEEFSACWKRQTQQDFQLVFVDDGSTDGTAEIARKLWQGDNRLTLIEQPAKGRGAALNTALAAARHEICLIADADDLSIPSRIARSVDFFAVHPDQDFLSFIAFNEVNLFRIGPPLTPFLSDIAVRSLLDFPASFPTVAFRKRRFTAPFDEDLKAGVDCDWLRRNMEAEAAGLGGTLLHYPAVYYRRHAGQLTRSYNDIQRGMRKKLIYHAFSRVLGPLTEDDRKLIDILVDIKSASTAERRRLGVWVMNLLSQNDRSRAYDPNVFKQAIFDAYSRVRLSPTPNEKFHFLRLDAERYLAAGDYRRARRALRKALRVKDDPHVRSRLLAAHRFRFVRALSRSKPFQPS